MSKEKDFVVEVRIKYTELMSQDELHMLSSFTERSTSAIKRKIVTEIVEKYMAGLPELDIDLSDLKDLVKQGIVDRKVDEVLERN